MNPMQDIPRVTAVIPVSTTSWPCRRSRRHCGHMACRWCWSTTDRMPPVVSRWRSWRVTPVRDWCACAVNGGKGAAVIAGLREAPATRVHACTAGGRGRPARPAPTCHDSWRRRAPSRDAVICGLPMFDASIPRVRFLSRYITHALVWLQTLSFSAVRDSMCGFRLYPRANACSRWWTTTAWAAAWISTWNCW